MKKDGWYVKKTHGSVYQSGLPDYYCCHKVYGDIWIETKDRSSLSVQQIREFTLMHKAGAKIYVVRSVEEYRAGVLKSRPNWAMSGLDTKGLKSRPLGF